VDGERHAALPHLGAPVGVEDLDVRELGAAGLAAFANIKSVRGLLR
jgi:hypothetical protein